jgi:hypothetical protein
MVEHFSDVPIKNYGVLSENSALTEIDEVAEQVSRLGYATINSRLTADELAQLSTAFNSMRNNYIDKYGEAFLRRINEHHIIRTPARIL